MVSGKSRMLPAVAGAVLLLAALAPLSARPAIDIQTLLDRISARLDSFNPKGNYTATIISTQVEHDRKWRPEKTNVQTKALVVTEGHREQTIVKVLEKKNDGTTIDVTERYLAEQRERRERVRPERTSQPETAPRKSGGQRSSRRGMRMDDLGEILPFAADRRNDFTFGVRETTDPSGRPLYVLDVKAAVKDVLNWEGTYTIDAATFTPVHGRLTPSEFPTFVKELEVEADFEVVEDVYLVPKRTWIKVNAGFLFIKRVHITSEETYHDLKIVR